MTTPHSRAISAAVSVVLLLLASASASGQLQDRSARMGEAVRRLSDLDAERITGFSRDLERQDIVRQEVTVCVDPETGSLAAECTLWVESDASWIRLALDDRLEVTSIVDSRGNPLAHSRDGASVRVSAPAGATFPLEIDIKYQGNLRPSSDSWVGDDVVVLGSAYRWYPASPGRDAARLHVEVRYPEGYASVISGTLAGMAPSLAGRGGCEEGDLWEVPSPVCGAGLVVGRLESALTVMGDVFVGYHRIVPPEHEWAGGSHAGAVPLSTPQEITRAVRFLENCYGPYPFEWLNVVSVPWSDGASSVLYGPGLIVLGGGARAEESQTGPAMASLIAGLSHSWWTFWMAPGRFLSEGLASWAEIEWLATIGDEDGVVRRRGFRRAQYLMALREAGGELSLSSCLGPGTEWDDRVCAGKGSAVLEMLEFVIGQDAFYSALKDLSERHSGKPFGFESMVAAFERASDLDLDWFFYEWMWRRDLPSYALEYESVRVDDGGYYLVRGSVQQQGEFYRTSLPLTIDLGGWSYDEIITVSSSHQPFEIVANEEPVQLIVDGHDLIPKVNRSERARMHFDRGTDAAASGEWTVAVDELGAASSLEPSEASYRRAYGDALVRAGWLAEGLEALERAVELEPSNMQYRLDVARLHARALDYERSLWHFDAYVAARPMDPEGGIGRSLALVGLGRLSEAEESLERVRRLIEDVPERPAIDDQLFFAAGRLYEARGDVAAAVGAYEMALSANPVFDEARRRLRALQLPPDMR